MSETTVMTDPRSTIENPQSKIQDQSGLLYSTFLGGSDNDHSGGIAVDDSGAAYVTGMTSSADFPTTPDAFDRCFHGGGPIYEAIDVFVVKLNPTGSALAYATFLGGSLYDNGTDIVVDSNGAVYVTGFTESADFPTTPDAFDRSFNGGNDDAFVAKLNPTGSALAYATFLGGSPGVHTGGQDWGQSIAVDHSGAAYVTGWTTSLDFPTTSGAFDRSFNGHDAFVAKLNPSGSALAYATFLGSSSSGAGIAVDGSGAAYVMGWTNSPNFPTTPGAFDMSYNGEGDAFVAKLNPTGSTLAYATYLGGSDWEAGVTTFDNNSIAVDGDGAAYVMGWTNSPDFPTTPGAFDQSFNGGDYGDDFVAKLDPTGSTLAYATFLGGSDWDFGAGIAVDDSGAAYVTGVTESIDFPTTPGAFDRSLDNQNAFVAKLNPAGSALAYATFLGGRASTWGEGIAVDGSGAAYVTGYTTSADFPATPGAFDTSYNGDADVFVAKLAMEPGPYRLWL